MSVFLPSFSTGITKLRTFAPRIGKQARTPAKKQKERQSGVQAAVAADEGLPAAGTPSRLKHLVPKKKSSPQTPSTPAPSKRPSRDVSHNGKPRSIPKAQAHTEADFEEDEELSSDSSVSEPTFEM
jgi:hypothetical protein